MLHVAYEYLISLLLIIVQITILNNIHVLGWAPPLIMIYPVIFAPILKGKNESLISAFVFGLIVDIFSNSFGINGFAFLTIAFLRIFLLTPYKAHELLHYTRPSIRFMGVIRYFSFVTILTVIFCTLIYFLEESSFNNFGIVCLKILLSSITSIILFTTLQFFHSKR